LQTGFEECLAQLGTLDILIVNHGIQRRHPAEEFPIEDWDEVLEVNLTSMFMLDQLAGQVMLAKGKGKIINVASLMVFIGGITVPAYAAAKGGVGQLTKALSNEWASRGVNVNAIAPGYMATEMNEALMADPNRSKMISSRIPAQRWGQPDDMKGVAIFLASDASDYVNGAIIPVDGGWLGR
jgi:2-deoxy-D-gluconate 3-dehydrogenase